MRKERFSGTDMTDVLDRVETLLASQESFIVSVKWVCERLREEMPETSVRMDRLVEALGGDGRFKLFGESAFRLPESLTPFASEEELEAMGIYRGPRVMLKGRIPTQKELSATLMRKADRTFEALKKAWETRLPGDEEAEDRLLEALAKAQRLQRDLRTVFSDAEERDENPSPFFSSEE